VHWHTVLLNAGAASYFPFYKDNKVYVKTLSGKVIRRDYSLFKRAKMVGVGRPLLPEISAHPFKNAEFQFIFGRSAVTLRDKV